MRDAPEMELMLSGYGLTTAQILYHMPDHPHLLQTYIWQHYDLAPKFPALHGFIEFWQQKLEGPLHSISYTHRRLIAPNEWRNVNGEFVLH
ncbi:aspartate-semialdehyde dehydrogenase [Aquibium carbonis]|uniref:Aspartate-semialdehyde dehydrogenase n=1 Tax=Aquibium carbonis TaxID=2495581 RepID=A0A3S0AVV4_9HYPH|nr:usg protein [Aquibium carbonis]RST88336.1 aspartate-semialdehyde dehydrogenase [Aquibium carbonis]